MKAGSKIISLAIFFFCAFSGGKPEFVDKFVNVPTSEFVRKLTSTISNVAETKSILQIFSPASRDLRLSNAVSDCMQLMDSTMDQLRDTLSAFQSTKGKYIGTGNVIADMKTWLSGAMINQETCKEGFDGTNNNLKTLITSKLDQAASSIYDMLVAVKPAPTPTTNPSNGDHPEWLKPTDWKLIQSSNGTMADAVVAADGSGTFQSITAAVKAAPELSNNKRYVIYIKKGVYNEYVVISQTKWNIMLIGDGMSSTIISGNRNMQDGWGPYNSGTFIVRGRGFIAQNITFENTAGPQKGQAVAFSSESDMSVLYGCGFIGYQDTLYARSQRQFYRECKITGTVDFIFGNATALFQNSLIQARKPLPKQKNAITAHGRNESVSDTGFSLQFCIITTEWDVLNSTETYLGRPWGWYSRTMVMQSYISNTIHPRGWLEWDDSITRLATLYYAEYMNHGPGAGLGDRVKWPGYHILNASEASKFTAAQFINGNLSGCLPLGSSTLLVYDPF